VGRGGIQPRLAAPAFQVRGDLSFSTMLKEYVQQDPVRTPLLRDPEAGPVTFRPGFFSGEGERELTKNNGQTASLGISRVHRPIECTP
jgi:hypothetical protein